MRVVICQVCDDPLKLGAGECSTRLCNLVARLVVFVCACYGMRRRSLDVSSLMAAVRLLTRVISFVNLAVGHKQSIYFVALLWRTVVAVRLP